MTLDAPRVDRRSFGDVTSLAPIGPGRFGGEVDPEWTIGGKPNGGYLLAMLGRAATWTGTHDHVVAASAHYLRPPEPGPVTVDTEILRAGRSATQVRARMAQDGRPCVESLVTASHLSADAVPYWDAGLPEMSRAGEEECTRFLPERPGGMRIAILEQIDVCLESTTRCSRRPTERARRAARVARSPRRRDLRPGGAPLRGRRVPARHHRHRVQRMGPDVGTDRLRPCPARPGPVRVLQRAQLIDGGRVDEACFVWDVTGRLVAEATQLAGIRIG